MNLFGETVVLAPDAVTYHRIHGTLVAVGIRAAAAPARAQRAGDDLQELRGGDARTGVPGRDCAAAAARVDSDRDRHPEARALGTSPDVVETHPYLAAHLIALEDFCRQLPALRSGNGERFSSGAGVPTRHCSSCSATRCVCTKTDGPYEKVANALIREFGIDELFSPVPPVARGLTAPRRQEDRRARPRGHRRHRRLPLVSVVILTALGRDASAASVSTPFGSRRIPPIWSKSSSSTTARPRIRPPKSAHDFPGARVIRNQTNLGFAAGNNQGAAACERRLPRLPQRRYARASRLAGGARGNGPPPDAAAVASYILDWSGTKIDFVDGAVNFQGKGFQLDYGEPAAEESRPRKSRSSSPAAARC